MSNSEQTSSVVSTPETDAAAKLPYNQPEFVDLGSIEQLTLGGSTSGSEVLGSFASV